MNKAQLQYFTKNLMQWHAVDNDRTMPWKEEKDPYKIWLSEILLQQTRTEQGLPYYLRFTEAYPTIKDMAAAKDEEVFRIWQGLGYYNRCRNMLATARYISNDLNGIFPQQYGDILALKGIGPYTAAAIASFAYNLPYAVVDGNVYRVLSRYFGIDTPIDSTDGKKQFSELAGQLLDKKNSAAYNQAIMDLGATVCKPAAPACDTCPLCDKCFAYKHTLIADLPVKSKKVKVKKRFFHYLLIVCNDAVWIRKRSNKDIWQNLYEPLLIEDTKVLTLEEFSKTDGIKSLDIPANNISEEGSFSQRLTHRIIESQFYIASVNTPPERLPGDGVWVQISDIERYAFPKSVILFLEKKSYF